MDYYHAHYSGEAARNPDGNLDGATPNSMLTPKKIKFWGRFTVDQDDEMRNELEDYLLLPPEDFMTCDPIAWWGSRAAQFPNLCHLARDILCIPGE
ncbi:MAG TPA: hAT transposon family protein [Chlamydiales bacterium]|nr:hAT transposon family protein [Chlamydiales bacterium]